MSSTFSGASHSGVTKDPAFSGQDTLIKSKSFYTDARHMSNNRNNNYQNNSYNNNGNNNRNRPIQRKFDGDCDYCGIRGHKQSDCFKKQRDISGSSSNGNNKSSRTSGSQSFKSKPPYQAQSHVCDMVKQSEYDSFPFALENNLMDIVEINVSDTLALLPTRLLKCNVILTLFNKSPVTVKALIDSGSSHSFISPKIMTDEQISIAKKECKRQNFSIVGATSTVNCQCCVTEASLELGPWSGNNVFILANSIKKHDMILGRDFLKSNGAVINHGHTLDILGQDIHLNAMEAIGSTWLNNDMQQELDTLQEVQCEVNSLEIPEPAGSMVTNVIFDTVVKANSQRLVKIHASGRDNFTSNLIIFEPCVPMPVDCLIGRSLHSNEPDIYCNVINAGNTDLTLSKGHEIGSVDEIEDANVSFEKQVDKFQPLDLDMVRQQAKLLKPECHTHLNGMISNEKLSYLERNMLIVLLARHNSVF